MNQKIIILSLVLAGCSSEPSGVRIAKETVAPPAPAPVAAAKSEPVFFNGKTYNFSVAPDGQGTYALAIAGMTASQTKDANQLSSTAFHHFTCKDSQKASLVAPPVYDGKKWTARARCV